MCQIVWWHYHDYGRTWQINRINKINRIDNRLIYLCKLILLILLIPLILLICQVLLWEGPQLYLAKVKDADGQDWYISNKFCPKSVQL